MQLGCVVSKGIKYTIKHYTANYDGCGLDKPFAKGKSKDFTKAWNAAKKEYNQYIKNINFYIR